MATKAVRYIGSSAAVDVRLPEDRQVTVKRNHQIEVDSDIAKRLLAEPENWEAVKATPEKGGDQS